MSLVDEVGKAVRQIDAHTEGIAGIQEELVALNARLTQLENETEPEPEPTPEEPTEPEPIEGDHVVFKPVNDVLVIREGQVKPGQVAVLDTSGKLDKIVIDGVKGTEDAPITFRLERPVQVRSDQHSYWQNMEHIKFDMRLNGGMGFEFQDRVFIRHSSYLQFYGFKSSCPDQVSWTCKPLIPDERFDGFLWDSCEFTAPFGEGIYIGGNGADPERNLYTMHDVVVRNCTFRQCAEGFHLAGVVGFLVENNTFEDILIAKPGAHNGAVSLGRGSHTGKVQNNIIRRSRGCGFNVVAGDGLLEFVGNEIDTVGTGAGDVELGKHIYGVRLQTGTEVSIAENTFRNILTAAVQIGSSFRGNRTALVEQVENSNTFIKTEVKVTTP